MLSLHLLHKMSTSTRKGSDDPWPRCHRTQTGQLPCAVHLLGAGRDMFFLPHIHKENVIVYINEVEKQRPNWAALLPLWASRLELTASLLMWG